MLNVSENFELRRANILCCHHYPRNRSKYYSNTKYGYFYPNTPPGIEPIFNTFSVVIQYTYALHIANHNNKTSKTSDNRTIFNSVPQQLFSKIKLSILSTNS